MELGLHIADFTFPDGPAGLRDDLTRIVTTAEEAGFANVSVMDHLWQIGVVGPPELEMLEAYTTLGYLAARTSKVDGDLGDRGRLPGTRAAGQAGQHPGRAVRRSGLARHRRCLERAEARGLGLPFPPTAERFERLEEALQICLQMWSDDDGPYNGKHYQLERTLNSPATITKPHPPILIGGGGEKKTLRLVAKYAQACNLFPSPELGAQARCAPRALRAGGPELRRHREDGDDAARPGRERREGRRDAGAAAVDGRARRLTHVHGIVPNVWKLDPLTVLGREVVPAIADW